MVKKIPIIIPAYGEYALLNKCIRSIIDNTTIPFRIIVVDDCYSMPYDNDAVTVLRNKENYGFTKSINIGLRYLKGDYDYVVILNSDTEVTKDWLESCIPLTMMDDKIGIVGGLGINPDADSKNRQDCEMADLIGGHCIIELINEDKKKYSETVHDMVSFSFFFALFTRGMVENIGLLDERYKTWCSDSDYCLTALSRGYRIVYNPCCIINHKTSATVKHLNGGLRQDQMRFVEKWCGGMANKLFEKIPFNCDRDIRARLGVGFYDKDNKPVPFNDIFPGAKKDGQETRV